MFYICLRSYRNGALSFVCDEQDEAKALRVVEMANHGRRCYGPIDSRYVVISAN
jgi:hypothetical protein